MIEDVCYEPLAEVYLTVSDNSLSDITYFLCSRVVISSPSVVDEVPASFPIGSVDTKGQKSSQIRPSVESLDSTVSIPVQNIKKKEIDETLSCYCSASHCSTDELESIRDVALHSDSGADLSESSRDLDWKRYWALHGEQLVWDSWIQKYSEYIDPSFYTNKTEEDNNEDTQFNVLANGETGRKNFSGLLDLINGEAVKHTGSSDYVLNSFQPDLDNGSELSEASAAGDDYVRLRSSSRSSKSSIFTDSLTNVTPATIYSSELSCSNEEFSIQSSNNSFVSSSDSISSNDLQWQQLWVEHFNDQYQACYADFISKYAPSPPDESYPTVFEDNPSASNDDLCVPYVDFTEDSGPQLEEVALLIDSDQEGNKENISKDAPLTSCRKGGKSRITKIREAASIGYLLNSLRSLSVGHRDNLEDTKKKTEMNDKDSVKNVDSKDDVLVNFDPPSLDCVQYDGEVSTVSSGGLPLSPQPLETATSYDESEAKSSDVCTVINCDSSDEDPTVIKNLKRIRPAQDPGIKKTKGAFNLMGFSFNEEQLRIQKAHVVYHKRNIKYHNRMLKLPRPHITFDEDGNPSIVNKQVASNAQLYPHSVENNSVECDNFSEKDDESSDEEEESYSTTEEFKVGLNGSERKERPLKRRKKRLRRKKPAVQTALPEEIKQNEKLKKYWYQRYSLFSKFDEGILLDEESWYSVTPEKVSKHIAERCRCDLIVDACCGAGGNTIQFAFTCERVIGIDIDPAKIELARHNARIYGVEDRIEFIIGDFFQLAPSLKADVVFLSPPWGGPNYMTNSCFLLTSIPVTGGGEALYKAASEITSHVAYFLPKNFNTSELLKLVGPRGAVEVEQHFLNKKFVAVTAYFGELVASA